MRLTVALKFCTLKRQSVRIQRGATIANFNSLRLGGPSRSQAYPDRFGLRTKLGPHAVHQSGLAGGELIRAGVRNTAHWISCGIDGVATA